MSARERFFRKMQQNGLPVCAGSKTVDADIARFCRQIDELVQHIRGWLEGSGIAMTRSTRHLSDLSTIGVSLNSGASRYDIALLRLQNDDKLVDIIPEQLYRNGGKGWVNLTVNVPGNKPEQRHFCLHMATESGWLICDEIQTLESSIPLTEEIFFRVIEPLA